MTEDSEVRRTEIELVIFWIKNNRIPFAHRTETPETIRAVEQFSVLCNDVGGD